MIQYICFNGEFLPENPKLMLPLNRAFRLGDGFMEEIFVTGKDIIFWEEHFYRINRMMKLLKMPISDKFMPGSTLLFNEIMKLLHKSKMFKGIKLTITVFRNGDISYFNTDNSISYLIEAQRLDSDMFEFNKQGVEVDIFSEYRKPVNAFSEFEGIQKMQFVLAGIFANANHVDNCFIMNDKWNICEAIDANIFIIKDNLLQTPALTEGCISSVLRKISIEILLNLGLKLVDGKGLKFEQLLNADEILLVNPIKGVDWVKAFRHKRYFNSMGYKLTQELNKIIERRKMDLNRV